LPAQRSGGSTSSAAVAGVRREVTPAIVSRALLVFA
jgi:hypothetical protein